MWGVINGNDLGWSSPQVVGAIAAGVALLVGFVVWEARHAHPMLPMSFFRSRAFSAANAVSLLMYFGMFGSIFLLSQFFQVVQGYSPFQAGLRTLPWTGMPIIVAPIAGLLADRIGGRPILATGMALQAVALGWLAVVVTPTVAYEAMIVPFILAGIGMGLFFAPIANVVLSAVRPEQEGKASGATNTIREVGGVFGVAVLAAIFSANGDYATPTAYVAGLQPAIAVGAVVVGLGRPRGAVHPGPGRGPRRRSTGRRRRRPRRRRPRPTSSPPRARLRPPPGGRVRGTSVAYPARMPSIVSHVTAADGTDLLVRHWPPDEAEAGGAWAGTPWASVLLVHGLGEHSGRYEHVGDQLTGAGLDVTAYDHRGMGGSGGRRGRRRALVAVPRRPRRAAGGRPRARPRGRPVVLYGHSLGGLIAAGYLLSDRPKPDLAVLTSPALDSALPGWKKRPRPEPRPGRTDALHPERHRRRHAVARPVGGGEDRRRSVVRQDEHRAHGGGRAGRAGARPRDLRRAGSGSRPSSCTARTTASCRPRRRRSSPRRRSSSGAPTRGFATSCTTSPKGPSIIDEIVAWLRDAIGRRARRARRPDRTRSGAHRLGRRRGRDRAGLRTAGGRSARPAAARRRTRTGWRSPRRTGRG